MNRNWATNVAGCVLLCHFSLALSMNAFAEESAVDPPPADKAGSPPAGKSVESAQELGEISVEGRFEATGARSATKIDASALDTPSSASAYTGSFMRAIETTNISDLFRYMTGVQRSAQTAYDMSFRGFATGVGDVNAILVDS